MRRLLNYIRELFYTDIISDLNLYTIISTLMKFIFVFIVLYFIYIIVKLILLDIRNIDFKKTVRRPYLHISGLKEDRKFYLESYNTIGRNITNDIVLNDKLVSNFHAEIIKSGDNFFIIDKDSLNGIYLNGSRIDSNIELIENDVINIGSYELVYKIGEVEE